jgi:uncharacterized protein (DUF2345 family)
VVSEGSVIFQATADKVAGDNKDKVAGDNKDKAAGDNKDKVAGADITVMAAGVDITVMAAGADITVMAAGADITVMVAGVDITVMAAGADKVGIQVKEKITNNIVLKMDNDIHCPFLLQVPIRMQFSDTTLIKVGPDV